MGSKKGIGYKISRFVLVLSIVIKNIVILPKYQENKLIKKIKNLYFNKVCFYFRICFVCLT